MGLGREQFDADRGGDLVVLTPQVTDGAANAINHIRLSPDGSVLVGQRARTGDSSSASREILNGRTDLFAVTNVRAALDGATPEAFVLSAVASHGTTTAFLGDPPRALVFSAAAAGGNETWDDRTLRIVPLAPNRPAETLDGTRSHYTALSVSRLLADDPESGD